MITRTGIRILTLALLPVASACVDDPQDVTSAAAGTRVSNAQFAAVTDPVVQLGQSLYEDPNLSVNRNQSCRTCHEPSEGFAAPLAGVASQGSVVQGSVAGKFGDRKPPSAAYATFAPTFSVSGNSATGGNFWDGRATGELLGNAAADQALGPFLNPAEQALPDAACVVYAVRQSSYAALFTAVWGTDINTIAFPANVTTVCSTPVAAPGNYVALSAGDRAKVTTAYQNVARAIMEFEASALVNKFSSRLDQGPLTALEQAGAKLFSSKGKCAQCHTMNGKQPLYTDFGYHNVGAPRNPANPVYGAASAFDAGLGGFTGRSVHFGKFKTPTVRNAALGQNRTYMHNGVFTSLKQVVDFYNTRDLLRTCTAAEIATLQPSQYGSFGAGCWPPPEHAQNMDAKQMGNLGLTEAQVDAIVAFLEALSDQ